MSVKEEVKLEVRDHVAETVFVEIGILTEVVDLEVLAQVDQLADVAADLKVLAQVDQLADVAVDLVDLDQVANAVEQDRAEQKDLGAMELKEIGKRSHLHGLHDLAAHDDLR